MSDAGHAEYHSLRLKNFTQPRSGAVTMTSLAETATKSDELVTLVRETREEVREIRNRIDRVVAEMSTW